MALIEPERRFPVRRAGWRFSMAAAVAALLLLPSAFQTPAAATEICTEQDFATAVDQAGARLREFNGQAQPRLQERLRALKSAKGWSEENYEDLALDYLHDARIAGLDAKANDLLTKIDQLGRAGEQGPADCSKLAELRATGVELLAVMKAKSAYTLEKLDRELKGGSSSREAAAPPALVPGLDAEDRPLVVDPATPLIPPFGAQPGGSEAASVRPETDGSGTRPQPSRERQAAVPQETTPPISSRESREGGQRPESRDRAAVDRPWQTTTDAAPILPRPEPGVPYDAMPAPGPAELPPGALASPEEGYTIEEIRDATRGFFGTISTNLATVIEHAFRSWGQPTAYVLGTEGGGAFLAGLRYGKGTLYMRSGGRQPVYWHGPSLGYDFGAEGSRTMFLIYHLTEPAGLFRRFTGVDGSAYLVGGVGITLLKGGDTIMAPIRTGVGLRLGASIGYVRFTAEPTWNPF